MTTEERERFAESKIINLIDTYGAKKFAHGMIIWYGCHSLIDNEELAEIEEVIKITK